VLLARVLVFRRFRKPPPVRGPSDAGAGIVNRAIVMLTAAIEATSESADRARPGTAVGLRFIATEVDAGRLLGFARRLASGCGHRGDGGFGPLGSETPGIPRDMDVPGRVVGLRGPEDAGDAFRRAAAADLPGRTVALRSSGRVARPHP
jgi:hypothetical protein